LDTEGIGVLDLKRFAQGIKRMCGSKEKTAAFMFDLTDASSSGELRAPDVQRFLRELVPLMGQMSANLMGAEHNFIRRAGLLPAEITLQLEELRETIGRTEEVVAEDGPNVDHRLDSFGGSGVLDGAGAFVQKKHEAPKAESMNKQ